MPARDPKPSARPRVSAIITTFNEEANIAGCIESLLWCDEILVVDSFSTDRTPEIVRGFEKVRFYQRTYYGSASQKNWAMDQVTNEWILIFDADERCTPALQRDFEHLSDLRDELEVEVLAQVLGDLVDVLLVASGRDHHPDPTALGGQRLLLEAADRQHLTGQRQLSGHRHVAAVGAASAR